MLASSAGRLAGVVTDAATDAGERNGFADEGQGFGEFALGDEGHVALDVDAGWAGGFAGCRSALLDGENARRSVVGFVNGCLSGQAAKRLGV